MAPVRGSRQRAPKVVDDSDSSAETERDTTPLPISGGHRRRLSEFNVGDGERTPLQAVNMNDDAAEKRRRRKSQKLTMLADDDQPAAGPSEPVSAARGLQRLDSVAEVPAIKVPLEVMSSNFEEWMKMATDNVSPPFACMSFQSL
jgi:condensin complex subunit 2